MSRSRVWTTGLQSCWWPLEGDMECSSGLSYPRGKGAGVCICQLRFGIGWGAKDIHLPDKDPREVTDLHGNGECPEEMGWTLAVFFLLQKEAEVNAMELVQRLGSKPDSVVNRLCVSLKHKASWIGWNWSQDSSGPANPVGVHGGLPHPLYCPKDPYHSCPPQWWSQGWLVGGNA